MKARTVRSILYKTATLRDFSHAIPPNLINVICRFILPSIQEVSLISSSTESNINLSTFHRSQHDPLDQ